jgi:FkbM family methyltransferase
MAQEHLKFKWSHHSRFHIVAVRLYNALMRLVPMSIKYGIGQRMRAKSYPYVLVNDSKVVVQVGAPQDTLLSGRSRGMYFALFSNPQNQVVIIEPDQNSVETLRKVLQQQGLTHVKVCHTGVWSEKKLLRLYINDAHPASNFVEGSKTDQGQERMYEAERMAEYRKVEIPVDTLDNILASVGVKKADLISITTNGAETEILKGMSNLMNAGLRYIALARTTDIILAEVEKYGYKFLAHDDRGYTFEKTNGNK